MLRHLAEYAVLRALGPVLFDNLTQIHDKAEGRRHLLRTVWNDYQVSRA
jgi:hypothetical protein